MKRMNGISVKSVMALALLVAASPLALAQTDANSGATTGGNAASTTTTNTTATGQKLTDGQIAAVVLAADGAEMNQAKMAEKKSRNKKVKGFAHHMLSDHGKNEHALASMDKKTKMIPEQSDLSQSMTTQAEQTAKQLQEMSGKEFDKAYIDAQVQQHQALLDTMNNQLIPNAQNPKLKAMLDKTAKTVSSHLEQAKRIQASMAG